MRTTSEGRPILTQLSGIRAAASFWLVLRHFLGEPRIPGGTLVNRGVVPTGVFILLSGFVTHYAYHGKPYETRAQVLRFYARRFGSLLFSYYASTLLMLLFSVLACRVGSCIGGSAAPPPARAALKTLLSLLMLQAFEPLDPSYPNAPAWTISTMGLMWLLYPKLQAWLRAPLARRPLGLALCAAVLCQLPMLGSFLAGCVSPALGRPFFASETQGLVGYHFPPLRLPDFVLGMALAQALADGRGGQQSRAWAWAADGSVLAVWAACGWLPWDPRSRAYPVSGYEPLFIGGMQPLIGLFIFASSCAGGSSSVAGRVLRHPVLQGLGEYSFQVYLWHWPLGLLFEGAETAICGASSGSSAHGLAGPFLVPYVLGTYLLSAAVSHHAEEPFRAWLRGRIDAWAEEYERGAAAKRAGAGAGGSAGGGAAGEAAGRVGPYGPLLAQGAARSDEHDARAPSASVGVAVAECSEREAAAR